MVSPQIEKVHGPARREIVKGLLAYNAAAVGQSGHRPLTVKIRERGRIVGGLAGETFFGWMFVSLLWVADKHRGKGWGTSLMRTAEAEARGRGVGRALIEALADRGRNEGWLRLYWQTARDNETAQKLYDKLAARTDWLRYDLDL